MSRSDDPFEKLPRALLQVILEQSDIDNSAIGVDVP